MAAFTVNWFILCACICFWCTQTTYEVITLNIEDGWTAVNSNQSISVPATVPGDIYTDLLNNGMIGDPYYRFNDVDYRWIGKDDWTYSTSVDITEELLARENIFLLAEGLDTAATVLINGQILASTDNMFVRYRWPVKQYLQAGGNDITIQFTSPVTFALSRYNNYSAEYNYNVPPSCPGFVQHGECHINFLRKVQSSFSWDWGPAFPTLGIWQPLKFEFVDSCIVRDLIVNTTSDDYNQWKLKLGVYLDCTKATPNSAITIDINGAVPWSATYPVNIDTSGTILVDLEEIILPTDLNIESWWPNGYGAQKLYQVNVTYNNADGSEISVASKRIGFRTVELIQDPIENVVGLTFYFKVNGVNIFVKGSNWIPADSFIERIGEDYYRNLLESASAAYINGLRVWGGGLYEQDVFYDITDELGILIWQDMMYACAMYPIMGSELQNSITTEIQQQIRRLQHHPSILVWSGNNENEAALRDNWYGTNSNFSLYDGDYITLYVDIIQTIVKQEDSSRPYVVSSPSNGANESAALGYVDPNPYDSRYGDVHFYNYDIDGWDWKNYPKPRFVSEYGFQSWPSFETLAKVSEPEDWDFTSRFMEHRQHHLLGNSEILLGVVRHMNLPTGCGPNSVLKSSKFSNEQQNVISRPINNVHSTCDNVDGFKGMLYETQIYQAMSIKTETEYYRRSRTEIINDEGFTMGALYWQLDDIWQGASWSSLEYGGKWKMLHYFVANFLAPILISPFVNEDNETVAYIVNDNTVDSLNLNLHVDIYRWDSLIPALSSATPVNATSQSALPVFQKSIDEQLTSAECSPEECFFYFYLRSDSDTLPVGPPNFIFLVPFFDAVGLQKATITVQSVETKNSENEYPTFTIVINSDNVAVFVWLEANGIQGRFSDNGFLMVKATTAIEFYAWQDLSASTLLQNLTVTSLMDLY